MDGNRFDKAIKRLTHNASRRKVFGGLLGGAAATLTGVSVLEAAKGGNGKGNAKGHAKQKPKKAKKAKKQKISFCHKTEEGTYQLVTVGASNGGKKKKGHFGHAGDVPCGPDPCQIFTGCTGTPVTGTCDSVPAEPGTECGDGQVCDELGNCA